MSQMASHLSQILGGGGVGGGQGIQGGGGGSSAAMVQQGQAMQRQVQQLVNLMMQMQQQAVQGATQDVAGATTGIANQIVRGLEQDRARKDRERERIEDRAFAEDMSRFNAKMQKDAAKEAQLMGAQIKAQQDAVVSFERQWREKKAQFTAARVAYEERVMEMHQKGFFRGEQGRKEFSKHSAMMEMMDTWGDDHWDSRHLDTAYHMLNDSIQRTISGGDPMDLRKLRVREPALMSVPVPHKTDKNVVDPKTIDPETAFYMKMTKGWPKGGVVTNPDPNMGLPEGYEPRLMTPTMALKALHRSSIEMMVHDDSLRGDLKRGSQANLLQAYDTMNSFMETYSRFNEVNSGQAPVAVSDALKEFMSIEDPNKYNNMGRNIMALSLKNLWGGGEEGQKMATIALDIIDGKKELKSEKEAMMGIALESAIFNIKETLFSEITGGTEGSMATNMVRDLMNQVGEQEALRILGVSSDLDPGMALVQAQATMSEDIDRVFATAKMFHDGIKSQSVIEAFKDQFADTVREVDVAAWQTLNQDELTQKRLQELFSPDRVNQQIEQGTAGMDEGELREFSEGASKFTASSSHMQDIVELSQNLGTQPMNEVAAWFTGGIEEPLSPNMNFYQRIGEYEMGRSAPARAKSERWNIHHNRVKAARDREAQNKKSPQPQQGQGRPTGQAFKEGGAAGVVKDTILKIPALIDWGAQMATAAAERTIVGTAQMVGGEDFASRTLSNMRGLQNDLARMMVPSQTDPSDAMDVNALTPQEYGSGLQGEDPNPNDVPRPGLGGQQ